MAAVNEAWRVLGDPGRRRRYDRAEAERLAPAAAQQPRRAPEPERVDFAQHDGHEDAVTRTMKGAPLVAIVVVLLAIFVVSAFAAHGARTSHENNPAAVVREGSCVLVATGEPVVPVSCDQPHDGVAAAVVPLDLSCPANTDYYVAPGGRARVCVAKDATTP